MEQLKVHPLTSPSGRRLSAALGRNRSSSLSANDPYGLSEVLRLSISRLLRRPERPLHTKNIGWILDEEPADLCIADPGFAHVVGKLAKDMPIAPPAIGLQIVLVADVL